MRYRNAVNSHCHSLHSCHAFECAASQPMNRIWNFGRASN
jgi:hypothetical protein